jgi:putative ABC transport system permease protein
VSAGQSPERVRDRLHATLGPEIDVLTRQDLIDREVALWDRSTPIGVIFTVGTLMGFVVGVIICYQVLATSITDHLSEFATLKAMGYDNRYFVRLTILQSVYLALLGFGPGLVLSWGLFQFNAQYTALPMVLTVSRIAFVLVATLAMCILSGLLALRKLFSADPASLF